MKYRSRPTEVEAWCWDGTQEAKEQIDRVLSGHRAQYGFFANADGTPGRYHVRTHDGQMSLLLPGDHLVLQEDGSLLTATPSEFASRWEPVA